MEQEWHPFHDRKRITNFLNNHDKIIKIETEIEIQNNYGKYR